MSVVLIDNNGRQGTTAKMLEMAAQRELGIVPDVYTIGRFRQIVNTVNVADSSILISVSESDLSVRRNSLGTPRTACESLQIAQSMVRRDINNKVILVSQPGASRITGVDAAAALLAGIAGIVDDRLLLSDGVLKSLYRHRHIDRRWRTMLAVGETAVRLRNVKDMFEDWDNDASSDTTQYAPCFKACLALAQLEKLKPIRGQGHRYSFMQLAQALNIAKPETSFRLSVGDLRKVLSIVANQLLAADDDETERLHLPSYVKKKLEFPSNLPVVDGISEEDIYQVLYDACHWMQVSDRGLTGNHPACAVRLPVKELRHLYRAKGR